ncbi:MAG TPA: hypothetical protein VF221_19370 [Chloroflexota bacterium]
MALSTLVMRVEGSYSRFDGVDWVLSVVTFLVIVDIWREYLMMVLAYVWLPTLLDSLVPFAFLAAEVFLAHFVFHNLRDWLLAFGACNTVGIAAWWLQVSQAQKTSSEEYRAVVEWVRRANSLRAELVLVFAALSFCAFGLYDVLRLGQVQGLIALVCLVAVIVFLATSVPYLNQILGPTQIRRREP